MSESSVPVKGRHPMDVADPKKILIIRFSSLGDIVQAMGGTLAPLKKAYPNLQIDWLTKEEFSPLLEGRKELHHLFALDKKKGLPGLLSLGFKLRKEKYDLIYDAHANLRSTILRCILSPFSPALWIRRSKHRWKRFLLFFWRINLFPRPFKGMESYWFPLARGLKLPPEIPLGHWPRRPLPSPWEEKWADLKTSIVLVPGAAWEMKRWPLEHFRELIQRLPQEKFIVLGGPQDHFCQRLEDDFPSQVTNLAGKLSLQDSCSLVARAHLVVAADTGLIHVADLAGTKGISLRGPTAFGLCTHPHIHTMEVELPCRPCSKDGRGACSQKIYQKCMVDIAPKEVARKIQSLLYKNQMPPNKLASF